jgi:hypothetical protein
MATTNFLQWNNPAVNQETDPQYLADSIRLGGAPTDSLLPSALFNKFAYQASTWFTAFSTMMANKGFSTSDADVNVLAAVFGNILTSADTKPAQVNVAFSPTPVFDGSLASSIRFTLAGNVTSSALINVPPAGGILTFFIVSTSPGNFFFTWPGNVQQAPTVQFNSSANLLSFPFISDGSNMWPLDTFVGFIQGELNAFQASQAGENTALTNLANAAQGSANAAQASANAAQGTANTALTTATSASNAATAAQGSANSALAEIAALRVVYTQHDVSTQRSLNQTFTNPYGLPMTVTGFAITNGGGNVGSVECFVNGGSQFANTVGATVNNGTCGFSFEVPVGATYEVAANTRTNGQGTAVSGIVKWIETTKSV